MNLKEYIEKVLDQVREAAPAGQASGYTIEVEFDLAVDDREDKSLYVYRGDGGSRVKFKAKVRVPSIGNG